MARDINKITISGHLGKDVELNVIPSGAAKAKFSVASGRSVKQQDGSYQTQTEWFNVIAWEKLAENCANLLRKGSHVLIEGRVQTRDWTDDQGQKRYITEVVATDMYLLDKKQDGAGGGSSAVDDDWDNAETANNTYTNSRSSGGNTGGGGNYNNTNSRGNANAGNTNSRTNASSNTSSRGNSNARPNSRFASEEVEPEDIPF